MRTLPAVIRNGNIKTPEVQRKRKKYPYVRKTQEVVQ